MGCTPNQYGTASDGKLGEDLPGNEATPNQLCSKIIIVNSQPPVCLPIITLKPTKQQAVF